MKNQNLMFPNVTVIQKLLQPISTYGLLDLWGIGSSKVKHCSQCHGVKSLWPEKFTAEEIKSCISNLKHLFFSHFLPSSWRGVLCSLLSYHGAGRFIKEELWQKSMR